MESSASDIKKGVLALVTKVFETNDLNLLIKDTSEIIGTVSTTYELMKNIYLFYERKKFEAFITSLFKQFHSGKFESDIDTNKVNEYFNNSKNIEHMNQIIDSSLHSHAIKCSAIMGFYAGGILLDQKKIEYRDKIIINALKIMNDEDLNNFLWLYLFVEQHPELRKNPESLELRTRDIKTEIEDLSLNCFELELTIEKLKSVQAIGYGVGGLGNVGNAWGAFIFNENSHYLYELVVNFFDSPPPPQSPPPSTRTARTPAHRS